MDKIIEYPKDIHLPEDIIKLLFSHYDIQELHQYELVCKNWRKWILSVPSLFHYKYMYVNTKFVGNDYPFGSSTIICNNCPNCKYDMHYSWW